MTNAARTTTTTTATTTTATATATTFCLSEAEILRRKTRLTGSEDLRNVIQALRYAEAALNFNEEIDAANEIADELESALGLTTTHDHLGGSRVAAQTLSLLHAEAAVSSLKVQCRDGKQRPVGIIVRWFADVHCRIAATILEAELAEE